MRTKHIDVYAHFIRNLIDNGKLRVIWVPTDENCSDVLNKNCSEKLCEVHHDTILNGKINTQRENVEIASLVTYVDYILCDYFSIIGSATPTYNPPISKTLYILV